MNPEPDTSKQEGSGEKSNRPAREPRKNIWIRFIRYQKRVAHKRRTEREKAKTEESQSDRAARKTAAATAWIAIFTIVLAIVGSLTLIEVILGGTDTHKLAVAAGNQAKWTQNLAGSADTQSSWMQQLADHMKDVADRTKDEADRTKDLADSAKISADAAKRAADIANQTLHISERAYLIMGSPIDDFQHGRIDVPIFNNGHIPSGHVKIIQHEVTFKISNPSSQVMPLTAKTVLEKHWRINTYQTIPVGNLFSVEVHTPLVVVGDLTTGKQGVAIAAVMTYNDGFPNTPERKWIFCDFSSYTVSTKLFVMRPCDNNSQIILENLIKADGYPDPHYQETN